MTHRSSRMSIRLPHGARPCSLRARRTRPRAHPTGARVFVAWALALTGVTVVETTMSAPAASADSTPPPITTTPMYQVFVDRPTTGASTPVTFTGRGNWSDATLSASGDLAVPLFAVGTDAKVPFRSSIIVTGLAAATTSVSAVRAALDGVTAPDGPLLDGSGCHGGTPIERAAITGYIWDGNSWEPHGEIKTEHRDSCQRGDFTITQTPTKFDAVMFVVDLFCGSADCSDRNGVTAGGTSMMIEVEGSGDRVFNSGRAANGITPARGDEGFEVVLGTENVEHYAGEGDSSTTFNGLTPSVSAFVGATLSVTGATLSGRTATVTTSAAHGLQPGDLVAPVPPPGCGGGKFPVSATVSATVFEVTFRDEGEYAGWLAAGCVSGELLVFDTSVGLESVPDCTGPSDTGPCLEAITDGWAIMLLERFGRMTVRPYKTVSTSAGYQPLHIADGDEVDFDLRLPNGVFRAIDLGNDITTGLSLATSDSEITASSYAVSTSASTLSYSLTARETTKVFTFGEQSSGGRPAATISAGSPSRVFFADDCRGNLIVENGTVVLDAQGQTDPDVTACQNESEASISAITRVTMTPGLAWLESAGHDFEVGDTVTVCCVYGAFDGYQEIVAVGNPTTTGATPENGGRDWFAFSTDDTEYAGVEYPDGDGDGFPDPEGRLGSVVERENIRVAVTSTSMDIVLSQPMPNETFLAGSYISTNAQAMALGDAMFDDSNPAFDFGLAGPSKDAAGISRSSAGYFRACIPAEFIEEKWALDLDEAQDRVNGQRASNAANRTGGLVATKDTCGTEIGLRVALSNFGYSAPYFAIRPAADDAPPPPAGGGGSTVPGEALPRVPESLAGNDRIATALAIAAAEFTPLSTTRLQTGGSAQPRTALSTGLTANAVVIVSSTSFADSLTAGPLAAAKTAPLLLTGGAALDPRVAAALPRYLAPGRTVYIVGGEAAVSVATEQSITGLGYTVVRLAGADRYATSVVVARDGLGSPTQLFVATGLDFPDGLTAGVIAARNNGAVLLSAGSTLPEVVGTYIQSRLSALTDIVAIGGPAGAAVPDDAVGNLTVTRVVGADRYGTALLVAAVSPPTNGLVGIASGEAFPDGLAATAYLARRGAPLLLVRQASVPAATVRYLTERPSTGGRATITSAQVFGGLSAVSDATRRELAALLM